MDEVIEEWKSILGGMYEVSNMGRVRSATRRKGSTVGAILKPQPDRDGYLLVGLRSPGEPKKMVRLHRIVATEFIPNPDGLPEVNHDDGDKAHNVASNLYWTTGQGNKDHAWRSGLCDKKIKIGALEIEKIMVMRANGATQTEIGAAIGVDQTAVSNVLCGKRKHIR